MIRGNRLYYHDKDKFFEIKHLEHASNFYGYDIIDSTHIFLAYYPEKSAEASTYLTVYNINTKEEEFIQELGGTGESIFQYHKENDLVVFNWYNGLNIFKLHDSNGKIVDEISLRLILECNNCYFPFWVDTENIGYYDYENCQFILKYYKIIEQ